MATGMAVKHGIESAAEDGPISLSDEQVADISEQVAEYRAEQSTGDESRAGQSRSSGD